jgi:Uncharacterized protein conserved in bacteria (DUF2059)
MRSRRKPLVLMSILLLGLARAEESAEEARARKVRELLDLSGEVGHVMGSTFTRGGASAQRHLLLLPNPREAYLDVTVPIYGKHLDDETLDAALAFFRSPAGRKYVASLGDAVTEWALAEAKPDSEVSRKLDHAAAASQCKAYFDFVMTWKTMRKQFPAKLEDLTEPMLPGTDVPFARIRPDPWGHAPVLRFADGKPRIVGLGPDGVEGTEDDIVHPKR